jgi:hypothetical protein
MCPASSSSASGAHFRRKGLMSDFKIRPALKVFAFIAVAHLAMVAYGAAGLHFPEDNLIGATLNYYSEMTGAAAGYGFFAPGVDSQIRAQFEISHSDGHSSLVQLESGRNSEFYLRTGDIIENFEDQDVDDPTKFQRDLSTSLSGTVFARYPDARSVTIHLDKFEAISMADYRNGQRPDWKRLYSATFTKKGETLQ